LSVIE
jgi:growth arrest-specific protein 8